MNIWVVGLIVVLLLVGMFIPVKHEEIDFTHKDNNNG